MSDGMLNPADYNYAFVTSTTQLPTTYGADLSGADALCNERAAAAALPGTYRAWLSGSTVSARDRFGTARGWLRTDGRPLADRVADLLNAGVLNPLEYDENGLRVAPSFAHTGSVYQGTATYNCTGFTNPGDPIGAGSTAETTIGWTDTANIACNTSARLYCFGIDKTMPLTITPAAGRIVFVTVQAFTAGGGKAAADALCNSEAQLAGFPGTYKALLGTSTASATAGFDLAGPTWVRPDGIPIATTPLAFIAGDLVSPINVTSTKTYLGNAPRPLTGANTLTQVMTQATDTCADWTDASGTASAIVGSPNSRVGWLTATTAPACGGAPLYCFQQ